MSNPKRKIRNLEAILQKREEVTGGRDVEFSWGGKPYAFPHPQFQDDEMADRIASATTPGATGVALLGKEQYEKFHAEGGQASYLMALLQDLAAEMTGETPDGVPTPPSTS